jgi:starch synthase
VPIVNNVGGLSDSIVNINRKNSNLKKATGFVMQKTSSEALYDEIVRAINCHQNIDTWKSLIENGMKRNSGWNKSANEYLKLYKQALKDNESVDQLSEVK